MTTLRHEVEIDAPVDAVWAVIAGDLTAVQHYNQMVSSARYLTEQRQGLGAIRRCELRPKGFVEERVWDWIPNRAIGLEVAASAWPVVFMKWRTELHGTGTATRVTQELSYKLKFGPLGAIMNMLVMRRKVDRGICQVFADLKTYVEAGQQIRHTAVRIVTE